MEHQDRWYARGRWSPHIPFDSAVARELAAVIQRPSRGSDEKVQK
jgi:hypothetical protein